jgi:glutamate--cysteine ligase
MTPSPSASTRTKKLIAEGVRNNRRKIWEWHLEHARQAPPPLYCSIDLRDSGHKIAPVDSNLYPAGFNNICPEDQRSAPPILRAQLEATASRLGLEAPARILVLPEAHTTNAFYIENLYYLLQIVRDAGFEVRLGWYPALPEGSETPVRLKSQTGKDLEAWPIQVEGGVLTAGGFKPDLVILNNDFSGGYPDLLDGVKQPILPSHVLGWHSRKKSEHFRHYNELAAEFAGIIGIDPWLIQIDTEEVSPVNFSEDEGTDRVADSVERILERTRQAYEKHKVSTPPFVFVKNNAGTYGMGIMVVHSASEVREMNRRTKNKMSVGKGKAQIHSVAVQEGIPTATLVDRLAAEPVVYLFGGELIGGFLRTNTEKGAEDNLNSQGMVFRKLCMSDLRALDPDKDQDAEEDSDKDEPLMELVYGSIARISALAAGRELAETRERRPT